MFFDEAESRAKSLDMLSRRGNAALQVLIFPLQGAELEARLGQLRRAVPALPLARPSLGQLLLGSLTAGSPGGHLLFDGGEELFQLLYHHAVSSFVG